MKDFGTSQSPKSTRQRDNYYAPAALRPCRFATPLLRSALATQHSLKWLDGVSDALTYALHWLQNFVLSPLRTYARAYAYRGLRAFASLSMARSGRDHVLPRRRSGNSGIS